MTSFFEPWFASSAHNPNTTTTKNNITTKTTEHWEPIYEEHEIMKIKAPKTELDRFEQGIFKLQRDVGIRVDVTTVVPMNKQGPKNRPVQPEPQADLLDTIFSDTLPFVHEYLIHGSPEYRFFHVKGSSDNCVDVFNKLCERMMHNKGFSKMKLEIVNRHRVQIGRKIFRESWNEEEEDDDDQTMYYEGCDLLEMLFTDDFSSTNPMLHRVLMA